MLWTRGHGDYAARAVGVGVGGGGAGMAGRGGAIPHDPMSGSDIGIFGYGPDGTYQWAVTYGASGDDSISSVALSAEGSVFVGGPFTQDFSVAGVAFTFTGSGPNAYAARIGPEAQ